MSSGLPQHSQSNASETSSGLSTVDLQALEADISNKLMYEMNKNFVELEEKTKNEYMKKFERMAEQILNLTNKINDAEERGKKRSARSAGLPGPPGPPGINGTNGIPGDQGIKGPTGAKGEPGMKGRNGENGKAGAKGDVGEPGSKGDNGDKGKQGEVGLPGQRGTGGVWGEKGESGSPGQIGPKGKQGEVGLPGPKGISGVRGSKGAKGNTGSSGLKGVKGDSGSRGRDGSKGEKGQKGNPGAAGRQGSKGVNGEKGKQGEAGPAGQKGPAGEQGEKGRRGPKGNQGEVGPPGQKAAPPSLSLDLRLIDSPLIIKENWKDEQTGQAAPRFPGGSGVVAEFFGDRLIVWGGSQRQKNGDYLALPYDVVYSFQLPKDDKSDGVWKAIKATGDIHPGFHWAASTFNNGALFIFGGHKGYQNLDNSLSTLSAFGQFVRLQPTGDIPSPRWSHRGFTHDGKSYFLGGIVAKESVDETRRENFVESTSQPGQFYTNEIYRYDSETNEFARITTTGARISPRSIPAVATLGNRVYIHGGYRNGALNDFLVLDMDTLMCDTIEDAGFPTGLYAHTLTPISANQLLLVGGAGGRMSNRVKIFNADKLEWKDEESLPSTMVGDEGGLMYHRAVTAQTEQGKTLLCIGGWIDSAMTKHPSHIAAFRISF